MEKTVYNPHKGRLETIKIISDNHKNFTDDISKKIENIADQLGKIGDDLKHQPFG